MPKPLACRVGSHTWSSKVEQGETYTVCIACGKERRGRWGDPPGTGPGGPGGPGDGGGGGGDGGGGGGG